MPFSVVNFFMHNTQYVGYMYCTKHNKQEKNCHCQSTTVMNKVDKCFAVRKKHTWAAVRSAHQQISSASRVHNLCKTKLLIVAHKTDTPAKLFFSGRKFGGKFG